MNNCYVGVDVGGTTVQISLFDENDIRIYNYNYPFMHGSTAKQEVEINICKNIEKVISEYPNLKLMGIGLSIAALFDRKTGNVINWPNNALWNGYNISEHVKKNYNVKVCVEDDVNCAAFGEYLFRRDCKNLIYINIGTGVGCGIIINKRIYTGESFAGELGHIKINGIKNICVCGQCGCLQSVVSGPALLKKCNELLSKNGVDKIKTWEDMNNIPSGIVSDLFNGIASLLSDTIRNLVMILDIRQIILGGGVVLNNELLFENLKKKLIFSDRKISLERAMLGKYSGSTGALGLINRNKIKKCINGKGVIDSVRF